MNNKYYVTIREEKVTVISIAKASSEEDAEALALEGSGLIHDETIVDREITEIEMAENDRLESSEK